MTRCKRLCLGEQVVEVPTLPCIKYFGDLDCKYLYRGYLNLKLCVRKQSLNNNASFFFFFVSKNYHHILSSEVTGDMHLIFN